ncbi:MAG TPA: ABC transporter permease subunit [Candidatus Dormibacteraeota bacterium]|nr:ABC transporter permease subunit [Candidatus Dormibacteraeota bacterium]
MKPLARLPKALLTLGAIILLIALVGLLVGGLLIPVKWATTVWAGGVVSGTTTVKLAPFPALTTLNVFDFNAQPGGTHFYLLGSDEGGRDLLALIAHGALPSLQLVAIVVVARLFVGFVAGIAMSMGSTLVRTISRGMGRWVVGFPYLALAIIVVHNLSSRGKLFAFVVGLSVIGWRDVAEVVAERVSYVRAQPFAIGAKALGTPALTFFRLHVMPHLRPALTVEIPFQASAVLVLLAELGYLQVYLGPVVTTSQPNNNIVHLLVRPELGQLVADARRYILHGEFLPAIVPAVAIALMALSFELIGLALRSRSAVRVA